MRAGPLLGATPARARSAGAFAAARAASGPGGGGGLRGELGRWLVLASVAALLLLATLASSLFAASSHDALRAPAGGAARAAALAAAAAAGAAKARGGAPAAAGPLPGSEGPGPGARLVSVQVRWVGVEEGGAGAGAGRGGRQLLRERLQREQHAPLRTGAKTPAHSPPTKPRHQVVFRHGARTPLNTTYFNGLKWRCTEEYEGVGLALSNSNTSAPGGQPPPLSDPAPQQLPGGCRLGTLTQRGYGMAVALGAELARRYVGPGKLLPGGTAVAEGDVYAHATNYRRTRATLQVRRGRGRRAEGAGAAAGAWGWGRGASGQAAAPPEALTLPPPVAIPPAPLPPTPRRAC
jgi:hypothetical protein